MDELIDHHTVAKNLGVTTRTLRTWIRDGQIPAPVRIGRKQIWVKPVLETWLKDRAKKGCDQQLQRTRNVPKAARGRPRLPAY